MEYIPRVTQLDAVQLDEQLEQLFVQQLLEATKYLEPGRIQAILPELELLIRTWIFKYSVYDKKCTFGQDMLSLKYSPEHFSKSKLFWYYGYTVGLKYLKDRALYSFTSNTKVQNFVQIAEKFQLIGDVLSFLMFIQNGRYPVFIDLLLGLRISAEKVTRENLSDFSWTRELLWNNLIELIGTSVSIINAFGVRQRLGTLMKHLLYPQVHRAQASGPAVMTSDTVCAACVSAPVLPHTMGCKHMFCYYCLTANKMVDEDYACPQCHYVGKEVTSFTMT